MSVFKSFCCCSFVFWVKVSKSQLISSFDKLYSWSLNLPSILVKFLKYDFALPGWDDDSFNETDTKLWFLPPHSLTNKLFKSGKLLGIWVTSLIWIYISPGFHLSAGMLHNCWPLALTSLKTPSRIIFSPG